MRETLRDIQKRYASRALYLALAVGLGLMIAGFKPLGKGLILGALFSALNFVLIGELLAWRVKAGPRRAVAFQMASVLGRMALMAVPVVVAATQPQFGLWGVVPGLFLVPAMILVDRCMGDRQAVTGPIQEG